MTGRIQKALSGFYYVDTGEAVLQCRARGKFRKEGISPLVGDRVEVRELGNGEGFVETILPRRNAFSRPAVANIDQLVVIASQAIPRTEPFLIDRVAAIAALKNCRVVVVLTREREYRKQPGRSDQAIARAFRRYPNFQETMRTRPERYNACREELFALEREGRALVIAPRDTLGCSRTERNLDTLRALWQEGYFDGRREIDRVRRFWTEE